MGRTTNPRGEHHRVVVLGLGRFGGSVALELVRRGSEVLAIDNDPTLVQHYADEITHTAHADTTDAEALRQLDVPEFERAVVAIGIDIESSILTTGILVDFAIPNIWAKAISRQHGRILERVGAHHVVLPEHDMGERVAHMVTGRMLDYIEFDDDFAMVKTVAPADAINRPLEQTNVRAQYGITVVAIKSPGQPFTYATADSVLHDEDVVIVSGTVSAVEDFANRT